MTTALSAPLKGAKQLTASPFSLTKTPLALPSSVPSDLNVFSVNTACAAFLLHACAHEDNTVPISNKVIAVLNIFMYE